MSQQPSMVPILWMCVSPVKPSILPWKEMGVWCAVYRPKWECQVDWHGTTTVIGIEYSQYFDIFGDVEGENWWQTAALEESWWLTSRGWGKKDRNTYHSAIWYPLASHLIPVGSNLDWSPFFLSGHKLGSLAKLADFYVLFFSDPSPQD